jgi:hypothetical protein
MIQLQTKEAMFLKGLSPKEKGGCGIDFLFLAGV